MEDSKNSGSQDGRDDSEELEGQLEQKIAELEQYHDDLQKKKSETLLRQEFQAAADIYEHQRQIFDDLIDAQNQLRKLRQRRQEELLRQQNAEKLLSWETELARLSKLPLPPRNKEESMPRLLARIAALESRVSKLEGRGRRRKSS